MSASKQIPEEAYERVRELIETGLPLERAAMAVKDEFGLSQEWSTVRRNFSSWRNLHNIPSYVPPLPEVLEMPFAGKVMALADCHVPYHCHGAVSEALDQAQSEDIKTLVLVGDVIDNDYCSQYMNMTAPGDAERVGEHIYLAYEFLEALTKVFKNIYVIKGNHDDRALKVVQRLWRMDHVWRIFTTTDKGSIFDRFTITDRFWMVMKDSPWGDYRFTHQKNYSVIRGRVAQRLVEKYRCNIVSSHCHDQVKSRVDDWWAVAPGCIADPDKVEYIQMRDTLNPKWAVGWATIDEAGVPHVHG